MVISVDGDNVAGAGDDDVDDYAGAAGASCLESLLPISPKAPTSWIWQPC